MAKKIKVELTEKQYITISQALESHCLDIMATDWIDTLTATENKIINNALAAMSTGYEKWKK